MWFYVFVSVDVSKVGNGEIEARVETDKHTVPCRLTDKGAGVYRVQFTPTLLQPHLLHIYYARKSIPGKYSGLRFSVY